MKKNAAIYRTLEEIVAPEHTALVVWDVQNTLVDSIFNKEAFLQNLKTLLEKARMKDIPIVYTKITPLPIEYEAPSKISMLMRRFNIDDPAKLPPFMKPGTPGAEINDEVAPTDGDVVINKHSTSIFIGTYFENMMKNHGIETILFTGISTEIGIASSARDSSSRGFYTVIVEDCVSSAVKEMHMAALKTLGTVSLVTPFQNIMKSLG